jgi:hypothetical protein
VVGRRAGFLTRILHAKFVVDKVPEFCIAFEIIHHLDFVQRPLFDFTLITNLLHFLENIFWSRTSRSFLPKYYFKKPIVVNMLS